MNIDNKNDEKVLIRFDGGSRGNPGLSGAGAVIYSIKYNHINEIVPVKELHSISKLMDVISTNNQAEYTGLIIGLRLAKQQGYRSLEIQGDSSLVVNQITGVFKCKSTNLIQLCKKAKHLLSEFETFNISHIYRCNNKRADELVNEAMNNGVV